MPEHLSAPMTPDIRRSQRLTVADLLALPVFHRGRPEVLSGTDLHRREVRWVHTSEIYDISPLLKGGEVLLTTGLGLVGAGAPALREYAHGLAERPVAALVLELGRTFGTAPHALIAAARDANLPLVTLRGIVPFVEITESVHTLLLSEEVVRLRLVEQIDTTVTAALLAGTGLVALLRELATLAKAPVRLYANDGHLVAASDAAVSSAESSLTDIDSAGNTVAPSDSSAWDDAHQPREPVELMARTWGQFVVCGHPTVARTLVAQRGAAAVALELGRVGGTNAPSGRRRAGAALLRDIFGRQYASTDEITGRAAALGLVVRPGQHALGICLAIDSSTATGTAVTSAVATAAERVLGPTLVAELDGSQLIATSIHTDDLRELMIHLTDAVDSELPSGRAVAVAAGPTVFDISALARSLRIAREASVLARRLHSDMRTLLCTDLGVHRLLSRFATDPELAAFVDEQLGPLLDYDAAHDRDLVRTLDTLLACGLSKSAAARALHIRRQTLYQRLDTISALLGGFDLAARERRTSLDLALVGWRLRTAGIAPDERPD